MAKKKQKQFLQIRIKIYYKFKKIYVTMKNIKIRLQQKKHLLLIKALKQKSYRHCMKNKY